MSNYVLDRTQEYLWELLKNNGWETHNTPDIVGRQYPRYNIIARYENDEVELKIVLVEFLPSKVAVVNFDPSPKNEFHAWKQHKVYLANFLEDAGKKTDFIKHPKECFIIEKPIDALSLIESYDRASRAFHYQTIIKE